MEAQNEKIKILTHSAIHARMDRIAWQIYESNFEVKEIFLAGLNVRGKFLADQLAERVAKISPIKVTVLSLKWNNATASVIAENENVLKAIKGNTAVIIDDVLYTGKTLFHSAVLLEQFLPSRIQCAVLIDRGHRNLPVRPDFVGMELATTLKQHVAVEVSASEDRVDAYIM